MTNYRLRISYGQRGKQGREDEISTSGLSPFRDSQYSIEDRCPLFIYRCGRAFMANEFSSSKSFIQFSYHNSKYSQLLCFDIFDQHNILLASTDVDFFDALVRLLHVQPKMWR